MKVTMVTLDVVAVQTSVPKLLQNASVNGTLTSLPVAAHATARVLLLAVFVTRHVVLKHALVGSLTVTFALIGSARNARTTSLAPARLPSVR